MLYWLSLKSEYIEPNDSSNFVILNKNREFSGANWKGNINKIFICIKKSCKGENV